MSAPKLVFPLSFWSINQFDWKYCSLSTSCDSLPWRESASCLFSFIPEFISMVEGLCVGVLAIVNSHSSLTLAWMKVLFSLCARAATISKTRTWSLTSFPPWIQSIVFFFWTHDQTRATTNWKQIFLNMSWAYCSAACRNGRLWKILKTWTSWKTGNSYFNVSSVVFSSGELKSYQNY